MRRAAPVPVAAALVTALVAVVVDALDPRVTQPGWRLAVVVVATTAAALGGAVLAQLARRRPVLAAGAGAVLGAALLAGLGVAALDGTRWGWYGLFGDSAFRTQMATRYAATPALVDYGYRDLPAYYPPAIGWVQGRLADLTGTPGWTAVKPVQLAVGAAVPVLAYALWSRVVGPPRAALVAVVTALWSAHPQKPDEWLVMACLVPWWLLAVRDVRAPGKARPRAWTLGVVLGLLVLVHTFYLLPLGVATVLALAADLVARRRGRPPRLPLPRAFAIGAVALLVSAPYWVGAVLARLRLPSDALQMRYSRPLGNVPPVPVPWEAAGAVSIVGLVALGLAAWSWQRRRTTDPLMGGLALALVGSLATMGLGAALERLDVGLLTFKTADLVELLLIASGLLGGARLLDHLRTTTARTAGLVTTIGVAAAAGASAHHVAQDWATGRPALVAQTTRYPDGSYPSGARGLDAPVGVLFVGRDDPPVADLLEAWDRSRPDMPRSETVLVTSRVDLLATTPVHGFISVKSIYSHPNGQFSARLELLRAVADCPDGRCAATLLRENAFDPVDGLVLERSGDVLALRLTVDDFPDRTRPEAVSFPPDLFAEPWFDRTDVGRWTVVAVR